VTSTPEEIVGVIEESRNRGRVAYLPAAITLNAVTGMRAGELCAP
jgi:integrase